MGLRRSKVNGVSRGQWVKQMLKYYNMPQLLITFCFYSIFSISKKEASVFVNNIILIIHYMYMWVQKQEFYAPGHLLDQHHQESEMKK